MDLLDSILNGMEAPPSVKKPTIKDKEKREKFEKLQKERHEAAKKQKEAINKFRSDITERLRTFVNKPITDDISSIKLVLEPMGAIYRSIVHEVAEDYEDDIVLHSFGAEDIDRHCVVWRKGYEPCEEEIRAMKLGIEYKKPRPEDEGESDDSQEAGGSSEETGKTEQGKDKFWSKYEKIIGENASGLESARVALPAKQYGCVPIENKKDQRSIEDVMNDIRKNKKRKTENSDEGTKEAAAVENNTTS